MVSEIQKAEQSIAETQANIEEQRRRYQEARQEVEGFSPELRLSRQQLATITPQQQVEVRKTEGIRQAEKQRALEDIKTKEKAFEEEAEAVQSQISKARKQIQEAKDWETAERLFRQEKSPNVSYSKSVQEKYNELNRAYGIKMDIKTISSLQGKEFTYEELPKIQQQAITNLETKGLLKLQPSTTTIPAITETAKKDYSVISAGAVISAGGLTSITPEQARQYEKEYKRQQIKEKFQPYIERGKEILFEKKPEEKVRGWDVLGLPATIPQRFGKLVGEEIITPLIERTGYEGIPYTIAPFTPPQKVTIGGGFTIPSTEIPIFTPQEIGKGVGTAVTLGGYYATPQVILGTGFFGSGMGKATDVSLAPSQRVMGGVEAGLGLYLVGEAGYRYATEPIIRYGKQPKADIRFREEQIRILGKGRYAKYEITTRVPPRQVEVSSRLGDFYKWSEQKGIKWNILEKYKPQTFYTAERTYKSVTPFLSKVKTGEPVYVIEKKVGAGYGYLKRVRGVSNVPTTLKEFKSLPKYEQQVWREMVEKKIGKPVSDEFLVKMIKKDYTAQSYVTSETLGKVRKGEIEFFAPDKRRSLDLFRVSEASRQVSQTDDLFRFTSETGFKQISALKPKGVGIDVMKGVTRVYKEPIFVPQADILGGLPSELAPRYTTTQISLLEKSPVTYAPSRISIATTEQMGITKLIPAIASITQPKLETGLEKATAQLPRTITQTKITQKLFTGQLTKPLTLQKVQYKVLDLSKYQFSQYQFKTTTREKVTPKVPVVLDVLKKPSLAREKRIKMFKTDTGYRLLVKRKGKFKPVGQILPRAEAVKLGAKITRETLGATFKVQPTKIPIAVVPKQKYEPSPLVFRTYQIKKGKKIPLKDTWIQRRKFRLGTRGEVSEIMMSKKSKRRFKLL